MKIPKVYKHDRIQLLEGVGNPNPKEYCKCNSCEKLRQRRDSIYNKWYHKIKRWCNNN